MATEKPTRKQIKKLEQEIAHDQTLPTPPAQKSVKVNVPFDQAVKQMGQTPPKKNV